MNRSILLYSSILIAVVIFAACVLFFRNREKPVNDEDFEYVVYSDPGSEGTVASFDSDTEEAPPVEYVLEDQSYYDARYPLLLNGFSEAETQEFYDTRYKDACAILKEYSDYNFNPDEVIAYLTPKEVHTEEILDKVDYETGYFATTDENLSDYFVTRWQPDTYPTDVDPNARVRLVYQKDYDPIAKVLNYKTYTWVRLSYSDLAAFEEADQSLRPVLFDISAQPVMYPDLLNQDLEVCVEEYYQNKEESKSDDE